MLGLKLNHVSKRGHWCPKSKNSRPLADTILTMKISMCHCCFQRPSIILDMFLVIENRYEIWLKRSRQTSWHFIEPHNNKWHPFWSEGLTTHSCELSTSILALVKSQLTTKHSTTRQPHLFIDNQYIGPSVVTPKVPLNSWKAWPFL